MNNKNRKKNLLNVMVLSALLLSVPVGSVSTKAADNVNITGGKEKVIINFEDGINEKAKKQIKQEGKIKEQYQHINSVSMEIESRKLAQLKANPNIKSIEPDIILSVDQQTVGYGPDNVNAPESWTSGLTGKGIRIAVIDSGVSNHSDLILSGGQSFVSYTSSFADDNGHGTHVAGIISAENNDFGVVGMAPDSEIYALKSMDYNGNGYLSDIIEAIDWSITNDMDIINMSLGSSRGSSALKSAVNKAYKNGILLVAAAGNEASTVNYPAKYDSVIAVSATDENNRLVYYSNFGREIEVAAPGNNIVSTSNLGDYVNMSGTSMATPFVTGQVALLKEMYPTYTAAQVREELHKNVLDLGAAGKDKYYGYGLIMAPIK